MEEVANQQNLRAIGDVKTMARNLAPRHRITELQPGLAVCKCLLSAMQHGRAGEVLLAGDDDRGGRRTGRGGGTGLASVRPLRKGSATAGKAKTKHERE